MSHGDIENMSSAEEEKAPEFHLLARGVTLRPGLNKITFTGKVCLTYSLNLGIAFSMVLKVYRVRQ